MKLEELASITQLSAFLSGTQAVAFSVLGDKNACYRWIQAELVKFHYLTLSKQDRGVVIQYLMKVAGYSRQQITRLINQYRKTGRIERRQRTVSGFKRKYSAADILLLAGMDERHETPCGQAIKKLCERAYQIFGDEDYEGLSNISISHLYNLRKSTTYTRQRRHFEKTKPRSSNIGERRKPQPDEQPGYIRIDTVHQGDLDKQKGVYHINAVDEVTQFEVVCSVEKISERYLIPVLEQLLDTFPFVLRGFHADNGSEYINHKVAKLLNKLNIELTKSRSRHSNDNALAESKNASVIRKTFGYNHIKQHWADELNVFNREYLNPFLNYHRPCYFPTTLTDNKGKQRKKYRYDKIMTPYEKLKSLNKAEKFLKETITFDQLDKIAYKISDNEFTDQMNLAKKRLFKQINEQKLA